MEKLSENVKKYDLFLSYERSSSKIVIDLYYKMLNFEWSMLIDRYLSLYIHESIKDISDSRVFLCFFTRKYRDSKACMGKLKYALQSKSIKVFMILLDNLDAGNLPKNLLELLKKLDRIKAYYEPARFNSWSDDMFCSFCDKIDLLINPIVLKNANEVDFEVNGDVVRASKYEIYCSYHSDDLDTVTSICERLRDFQVNMWFDAGRVPGRETVRLSHDVQNAILDSEIFLCFASEKCFGSHYSQIEIKFAKKHSKKCIYFMIDNLNFYKSGYITLLIAGSLRFNAYEGNCMIESQIRKLFVAIYTVYSNLNNSVIDNKTKLSYSPEVLNSYRMSMEISTETKRLFEKLDGLRISNCSVIATEKSKSDFEDVLKQLENQLQTISKQKASTFELLGNLDESEKANSDHMQELMMKMSDKSLDSANRTELEKKIKRYLNFEKAFIEQLKYLNKEVLSFLELETVCLAEIYDVRKSLRLTSNNNRDFEVKNRVLFDARIKHFNEYKRLLTKEDNAFNMLRRINIFEKYGVMLNNSAHQEQSNDL
jgi:hypothetical protein